MTALSYLPRTSPSRVARPTRVHTDNLTTRSEKWLRRPARGAARAQTFTQPALQERMSVYYLAKHSRRAVNKDGGMTFEKIFRAGLKAGGALSLFGGLAAVALVGCPSGGVGDPCIPEDEYRENFAGFQLAEENIESRSFQCQTRICLVNHFQGRVSCPRGQAAPEVCSSDGDCSGEGETCRSAGVIITDCDPTPCSEEGANPNNCNADDGSNQACGGNRCDEEGRFCRCQSTDECPDNYFCQADQDDPNANLCNISVCSPGPNSDPDEETNCFIPGTEIPVATEVCAQCATDSPRNADNSVYCSCRCGPPLTGASEADDSFNFCECPDEFVCAEVRPSLGLGDPNIAGQYCVRVGTEFDRDNLEVERGRCGQVQGHWNVQCDGEPSTTTTPSDS